MKKSLIARILTPLLILLLASAAAAIAQDAAASTNIVEHAPLPPVPAPMNLPHPGLTNDAPYAPQPILPGGIVIPLWPPGSPYLNMQRVAEAEVYNLDKAAPGRISSIMNIHNPSIEVHTVGGALNTGAVIILAAGGAHNTLNVGGEAADFVPFLFNYGISGVILRNRLRSSGYNPKTDEVYDIQQAIRMVRAHAKEWRLDPGKIGIMGFSAGAELASSAAVYFDDFDKKNSAPGDPLSGISSRPDFAGIIYPGPSPFTRGATPPIPRNTPPAFITCAGWGDPRHAVWAGEYFTAMLNAGIPNVEMHIYARGHHPGDPVGPGEPPSTGGLTDRGFISYGTWQYRFIDWFKDLGFFNKSGEQTQAARDVETFMKQPPRRAEGGGRSEQNAPGTNAAAAPPGAAPAR